MNYQPGGYNMPPANQFQQQPNKPNLKPPHFVDQGEWLQEQHKIRRLSTISAVTIIVFIGLSAVLVGGLQGFLMILKNIDSFDYERFSVLWNSAEFQYLFDIIYSVFAIGMPFFIAGRIAYKKGLIDSIPMGKPKKAKMLPLILFGGFGLCLFGNIIISVLDSIFYSVTGLEIETPELPIPKLSVVGILVYYVAIAVIPALIEEMALRGIIMQMLRRHGDGFAIIASAIIFGLMHCNLQQIPFAFLAGAIIGYAVIATESLWTGVIIHFMNNAFSATISLVGEVYGYESEQMMAANVVFYAMIAIGIVCAIMYFRLTGKISLKKSPLINQGKGFYGMPPMFSASVSQGRFIKTFLLTAPMIIAFIAVAYETVALFLMT